MTGKRGAPKKGGVTKPQRGKGKAKAAAVPKSSTAKIASKKETEKPKSPVKADNRSISSEKGKTSQPTSPKAPKSKGSASPKGPTSPKAAGPKGQATPKVADSKQSEANVPELKKELSQAAQRRKKLADELQHVEKQIFDLETTYLESHHPQGNALRGYEGLLTQGAASTRRVLVRQEDRLFSNSSLSGLSRGEKIATGASGLYAFK